MPVNHCGVLADKLPLGFISAIWVGAFNRLSIFKLLLQVLDVAVALKALEVSFDELWLGISGPRDSSVDGHESTKRESSQLSDLVHLWKIVNCDLIIWLLEVVLLLLILRHESCKSRPQILLTFQEILNNVFHEFLVLVREVGQVREIDVHGHLFLLLHLVGFDHVIQDWLTLLVVHDAFGILGVVWISLVELETILKSS